jgi:hypothetical protein
LRDGDEKTPLRVEAAIYLLSQYRHIETEEFKRRVAVDPAMQWGCHHWIFCSRR